MQQTHMLTPQQTLWSQFYFEKLKQQELLHVACPLREVHFPAESFHCSTLFLQLELRVYSAAYCKCSLQYGCQLV